MSRSLFLTASVVAVLTTGALAQTQTAPTPPAATPAPMDPARPATRAAQPTVSLSTNEFTANKLIGIAIYAPKPDAASATPADPTTTASTAPSAASPFAQTPVSDEQWRAMRDRYDSIGKIDDLVIGADGRISHAVVGVGGFLGIGEKKVALELRDVKLMRSSDGTVFGVVMRTKQQLQDMPTFVGERS